MKSKEDIYINLVIKTYGFHSDEFTRYLNLCSQAKYVDALNYINTLAEEILLRRLKIEKIINKIK